MEENPNLAAEQAQAQRSLISNLQNQAQMDTANIMARYGTLTALANAGFTPTYAAADAPGAVEPRAPMAYAPRVGI
jgi:hypothetical protein